MELLMRELDFHLQKGWVVGNNTHGRGEPRYPRRGYSRDRTLNERLPSSHHLVETCVYGSAVISGQGKQEGMRYYSHPVRD